MSLMACRKFFHLVADHQFDTDVVGLLLCSFVPAFITYHYRSPDSLTLLKIIKTCSIRKNNAALATCLVFIISAAETPGRATFTGQCEVGLRFKS